MKTIMVASFNHRLAEELNKYLRPKFEVTSATSEGEIIEAAGRGLTDILVLHSCLESGDSFSVLRRLQQSEKKIFVLFVEVTSQPGMKEEALAEGAYHVVSPPLKPQEIKLFCLKASQEQDLHQQVFYLRQEIQKLQTGGNSLLQPEEPSTAPERNRYYYFQVLRKFSWAITHILNLDKILQFILDSLQEAFDISNVTVLLEESNSGQMTVGASTWLPSSYQESLRLNLESGLPAWLVKHQQILREEELGAKASIEEALKIHREMEALKAKLIIPLLTNGKLVGLVASGERVTGKRFSEEDLELFSLLGSFFAIAIENSILLRQISIEKKHSQSILENMSTGVVAVDKDGIITTINKSACDILRFPNDSLLHCPVQKIGSRLADLILRTIKTGQPLRGAEIPNPINQHPLLISTSLLYNDQSRIQGVIMLVQDLREQKKLEAKIQHLERRKFWSELAARMAHEVKNPLVAIRTFAELLPERYDDPKFRNQFSTIVLREIDRLDGIIENLLRFAQPIQPRMEIQDIHPLLEKVFSDLWSEASEKKVTLKKQYASNPITVNCDSNLLKEGLEQIMKNAIEAYNGKGEVVISTRVSDGQKGDGFLEIVFTDQGDGIAPENLEKIFSPFFTTKTRGIGFGLALAQRIIRDHRGEIMIRPRKIKGTEVIVQLPLANAGRGSRSLNKTIIPDQPNSR